jgi:hypothetical protein
LSNINAIAVIMLKVVDDHHDHGFF